MKAFLVVFDVLCGIVWTFYAVSDYKHKKIANCIFDAIIVILAGYCLISTMIR